MGSPFAIVTHKGELLTTGSINQTDEYKTSDILIGNDQIQLLTEILKQTKITNLHLESITDIHLNKYQVE